MNKIAMPEELDKDSVDMVDVNSAPDAIDEDGEYYDGDVS